MLAWLSKHACSTKSEHWSFENFTALPEERYIFRLGLQDSEDGRALFSLEREQFPGEDIGPPDADLWEYWPRDFRQAFCCRKSLCAACSDRSCRNAAWLRCVVGDLALVAHKRDLAMAYSLP